jgi:hypothetical protein
MLLVRPCWRLVKSARFRAVRSGRPPSVRRAAQLSPGPRDPGFFAQTSSVTLSDVSATDGYWHWKDHRVVGVPPLAASGVGSRLTR